LSGSILLGAVAARTDEITIACRLCPRQGRLRTDRLLQEHGPTMEMPDLLRILAGDCPKANSDSITGRCDAHCPTLSELFMPVARLI
jgi:hypothetical protein